MKTSYTVMAATAAVVSSVIMVDACGKSRVLPALGIENLRPGAVMDFRSMRVLDGSFWTEEEMDGELLYQDDGRQDSKLVVENDLKDRYNSLDVSASIKVEVAAGQVVVGGSVNFLFMKKANKQVARVVYTSTRRTKTATFTEDLLQLPQLQSRFLTNPRATHVVTRVTYGARTVIGFDTQANDAAEAFRFGGSISVELKSVGLSGAASLDVSENTREALNQTTIRVASDLPLTKTPINIDDVMEAIRDVPKAMKRVNGGLGVPVEITLTPICKWKGDSLALEFRELTEEAVEEVFELIANLVESEERTQTMMDNARFHGLPALLAQGFHFSRILERYIATVRGRLVQLLPLVRGSMADQSIILKYIAELNQSPFNQIAINRWLETGEEDVRNQAELRSNLLDEASLNGAFINRQILLVNDFPSLQRLLVDPSVDTVMVLVTVNRNNGLDYYSKAVLEEFLNNPPLTKEEKQKFPTNFQKAKWLEAPGNAAQTRRMTVNIARWAARAQCVINGCRDLKTSERLAMVDYTSFKNELNSIGVNITRTTVLLYRSGKLVNQDFQVCASRDDPRDTNGNCLWSGDNNIPDGFSCALAENNGGCAGMCQRDGYCGQFECGRARQKEDVESDDMKNDWFQYRMWGHPLEGMDWITQTYGGHNMCLAYTPDSKDGLRLDPCLSRTKAHKFRWGVDAFFNHIRSVESQYEGRCFEAVIEENEELSRQGYVTMSQCVSSNRRQLWQRTAREYSLPRLMLRPPEVLPYDYVDLCVQVRDDRLGLDIHYCDDNVDMQVLVETFQIRPVNSFFETDFNNSRALTVNSGKIKDQITTKVFKPEPMVLAPNYERVGQFWYRQGQFLRPWHTGMGRTWVLEYCQWEFLGTFYPYPCLWRPIFASPVQFQSVLTGKSGDLQYGAKAITEVEPVFPRENEFITSELASFFMTEAEKKSHCLFRYAVDKLKFNPCPEPGLPEEDYMRSVWLECPEQCTPDVCEGRFNSRCVTKAGVASCECLPGWDGDEPGNECKDKIDPCDDVTVSCKSGEYCTATDPFTTMCLTVTPCIVGEYLLLPSKNGYDNICKKCPPGKVQPVYDIKEIGRGECMSRAEAAQAVLDALLNPDMDEPATDAPTMFNATSAPTTVTRRRRLKNIEDLDEQEASQKIWKVCKDQNRFFVAATVGRPARCAELACPNDKIPSCDVQGFDCGCVFAALAGGLQNDLEFGLMLMASAVMGMLMAAVLVMLFEIKKTKMHLKMKTA